MFVNAWKSKKEISRRYSGAHCMALTNRKNILDHVHWRLRALTNTYVFSILIQFNVS